MAGLKWYQEHVYKIGKQTAPSTREVVNWNGFDCITPDERLDGFSTLSRAQEVLVEVLKKDRYKDFEIYTDVRNKNFRDSSNGGGRLTYSGEGNFYLANTVSEVDKVFIESTITREGLTRGSVSFNVTGRTYHQMLANELAKKLPQLKWTIGYNYVCDFKVVADDIY